MNGAGDPVERARAAALGELRRAPKATPWRRQALAVVATWLAVPLLACAAALAAALTDGGHVLARAPFLASLLAIAALAGLAAVSPRARPWTTLVLVATPVTMAALVWSRGAGVASMTPEWVCSVSHVGVGLVPLAVGLWALRQAAWTWRRALAAGLGAGTAGAVLGELACHQGARHVLVHHVGAWLFIGAACVLISRALTPRTFAT